MLVYLAIPSPSPSPAAPWQDAFSSPKGALLWAVVIIGTAALMIYMVGKLRNNGR